LQGNSDPVTRGITFAPEIGRVRRTACVSNPGPAERGNDEVIAGKWPRDRSAGTIQAGSFLPVKKVRASAPGMA
jgi:hypothetical protein